jgi:hypothetical protein
VLRSSPVARTLIPELGSRPTINKIPPTCGSSASRSAATWRSRPRSASVGVRRRSKVAAVQAAPSCRPAADRESRAAHHRQLAAVARVAHYRSRIVREHARHRRQVTDVVVHRAKERDDRRLVGGDAVKVTHALAGVRLLHRNEHCYSSSHPAVVRKNGIHESIGAMKARFRLVGDGKRACLSRRAMLRPRLDFNP